MNQDNNPNSFDAEFKDAKANPDTQTQGTESETTVKPNPEAAQDIDYRKKFSESSSEAQRLLNLNKEKDAEIERLRILAEKGTPEMETTTENLYPGFELLDPEAQRNLMAYTESITNKTLEKVYSDPSITYARNAYNESQWDKAFESVATQYPELKTSKDEFKSKYFTPTNVPKNIENILTDVAKIHLFDKAKDMGAQEERKKADRIDMERSTGGEKTPQTSRSLSDWNRMAQENPAKFASMSKQYNDDLASGKI